MRDFETVIPRLGTYSVKWDGVEHVFGRPNLHPMWVADMDFKPPQEIIQTIKMRLEHEIFGYTMTPDSLKKAICNWQRKKYKWDVQEDSILVSPGVVTSIATAVQALSEEGDKILMHSPVYPPFFSIPEANARQVVYSTLIDELEQYQIDWADFENKLKDGVKLFILCHPHNPAGRVWTQDELQKMIDLCKKYEVIILSDEIHCDLTLPDYQHIPLATVDPSYQDQIITFIAPSKTFNLAGLQASSIIVPNEELRTKLETIQGKQGFHFLNIFGAVAMEAAYTHGEAWLDDLLKYLQENVQVVQTFLKERLPQIKMKTPGATYLLWLDCRELGVEQDALVNALLDVGELALENGEKYGPTGKGYVRMNIACPRALLVEGLERLERAISDLYK
ncbi:pyridoxal phosphate-dependent aminotransferase [Bacillus carboniphilus]|uniref:cysteine-S-conjugate beta-lyase n=1 Tax=Bacillus carboniphilus TaxID=86663 RepID=A0ABN0W643_9BACI